MNNVLDLTADELSEAAFIFALKQAFDSGQLVLETKINTNTALSLHGSPHLTYADMCTYHTPWGVTEITVVPAALINQTIIT